MKKIIVILFTLLLGLPFLINQASAATLDAGTVGWAANEAPNAYTINKYLEFRYVTPTTGNLTQLQIAFHYLDVFGTKFNYFNNTNLVNFSLWVNGVNQSAQGPDAIVWDLGSSGFNIYGRMYYNFTTPIALTADPIVFELRSTIPPAQGFSTFRASAPTGLPATADLNNDGNYSCYRHTNATQFGDGVVNGYTDCGSTYNEVGFRFTVTGYTLPYTPPVPIPHYTITSVGNIGYSQSEAYRHYRLFDFGVPGANIFLLEGQCITPQTGWLQQFDLAVWSREIAGNPKMITPTDFNKIKLYINNEYIGPPTEINWLYTTGSGGYTEDQGILTWYMNKTLTSDIVVYEIVDTLPNFYFRYAASVADGGPPNGDLNGDGVGIYYHNPKATSGGVDGLVNGITQNRDLGARFWIQYIDSWYVPGGGYSLGGNYLDITGNLMQYQPLYIHYSTDSLTEPCYINISTAGGNISDYQQNVPYRVPDYYGTYVYVPQTAVAYTVNLLHNKTVVASTSVTTKTMADKSFLQVRPALGSLIDSVKINWTYAPTVGGVIGVFDSSAKTNALANAIDTISYIPTGSDSKFYKPPLGSYSENRIFYRLFANTTTSEPVSATFQFTIFQPIQTGVNIRLVPYVITNDSVETFYYTHNFVNAKIALFLDAIQMKSLGDAKEGAFNYKILTGGLKQIDLRVWLSGDWRTIYSTTLNCTGGWSAPGTDSPSISGWLGPLWSAVFGLIIVVLFILIPTIIDVYATLELTIPAVVYVLLGSIGVAIAVILGLWPFWVTFFLLTTAVLYLVIQYLVGHGISVPGVSQVRNVAKRIRG